MTCVSFVVPKFLILHMCHDWPEAESEALQEEKQHVGASRPDCGGACGGVR